MTTAELAHFLVEGTDTGINDEAEVFANRLVLRLFNAPGLLSYLRDVSIVEHENGEHSYKFQFKFSKLPDDIIPQVKELIGVKPIRVFEFDEKYVACTGFEFTLTELDKSAA